MHAAPPMGFFLKQCPNQAAPYGRQISARALHPCAPPCQAHSTPPVLSSSVLSPPVPFPPLPTPSRVDLISDQPGLPRDKVISWTPYAGGAPCNVATALGKVCVGRAILTHPTFMPFLSHTPPCPPPSYTARCGCRVCDGAGEGRARGEASSRPPGWAQGAGAQRPMRRDERGAAQLLRALQGGGCA